MQRSSRLLGCNPLSSTSAYEVGCARLIEQSEPLEDGRYNIGVRGTTRFLILERTHGRGKSVH